MYKTTNPLIGSLSYLLYVDILNSGVTCQTMSILMQLELEPVIHAITLLTFSAVLIFVKQLGEELWFTVGGQHISFGASPQVLNSTWNLLHAAIVRICGIILLLLYLFLSCFIVAFKEKFAFSKVFRYFDDTRT